MIDILTKLKTPDKINISGIKWYWDNTPSVTWILSLIDSYEPNSEDIQEALDKWTNFHNDMESVLWWKTNYLKSTSNIFNVMPYASFLIPQDDTELLMLEHSITIPWVFWWTIDYDKEKRSDSFLIYSILDYKTAKVFPSMNSPLFYKYKLQLKWYSILKNAIKKAMVTKETLLFVSDATTQFVKVSDDRELYMDFFILLMYYHFINGTLSAKNTFLLSILRTYSGVIWLLELHLSWMNPEEISIIESKYPGFFTAMIKVTNDTKLPIIQLSEKDIISKPKHIIVYKDINKTVIDNEKIKEDSFTSKVIIDDEWVPDEDYDMDYDESDDD